MDDREKRLLEQLQGDARVRVLAELTGGRVVIEIPVGLIEAHADLRKLRGGDDLDTKLLAESVKKTGQDTLYPISLLAQKGADDELQYFCGDGAQRLKALKANAVEVTAAQVILRWRDERDAMEDCLAANVVRYEWSDADIYSVIRSGKLSTTKLKDVTGFSESTIERYETVAPHEWLTEMVDAKCMGYSKAHKYVAACDKNPQKLEALRNTLCDLFQQATRSAEHYKNEEKRSGLAPKDRKKKSVDFWFKSFKNELGQLQMALDDDDGIEKDLAGKLRVKIDPNESGKQLGAYIGLDDEWKKTLALANFFERDADDVPLASYELVLDRWDAIRQSVEWHRDRLLEKQFREKRPLPSMAEQVAEPEESAPPVKQAPNSEVVDS